ncbi:MAG: 3-dehydroquinate synthase [Dehalococcoidales bacterium]|nr:3-dehydroquinate synthase [Dehalococcoidales bacterium]
MKKINVELGNRSYEILIGSGLLNQTPDLLKEISTGKKLAIITNPVVRELYGNNLKETLSTGGFNVALLIVPDGEQYKSLETAGRLYTELAACFAERTTPIIALGGGVIGDLAGFVASTYMRGVPLVHIPTTLLAQVDSSIGGKVAVDHGKLKNNIGTFYQPRIVISDMETLRTLPHKEFANGMAEVIKSAVICDSAFFTFIERNLDRIKKSDVPVMEEVVSRTANIKASVVAQDERDTGLRNILNFGHTIGHAIETTSNFDIAHGQAVAIGMIAEAKIARIMGIFKNEELLRLERLIIEMGLPAKIPDMDTELILQAIKHDKKINNGKIRFALLRTIGDVFMTDEVESATVKEVLKG